MGKVSNVAVACALACVLIPGCAADSGASSSKRQEGSFEQSASDVMLSPSGDSQDESGVSSAASAQEASAAVEPSTLEQTSADMRAIAEASGMTVGTVAIDLESGSVAGYRSSERMVSASMIKLAIAAAFLERVQAGDYSLDDAYVLQASDIVGGTGTLGGYGAGASVTYGEILNKMISVSDNTGTNILIDAAGGMQAVNEASGRWGLVSTQLNRYMMDSGAMAAGIENYTSADDVAQLLQLVYEGNFVDADASALVLQALEEQQDYGGVLAGLPSGVPFAHKTGTLATVRHDGGIVEGEHPYVLVVLCAGEGFTEQGALNTMAQLASATWADIVG